MKYKQSDPEFDLGSQILLTMMITTIMLSLQADE